MVGLQQWICHWNMPICLCVYYLVCLAWSVIINVLPSGPILEFEELDKEDSSGLEVGGIHKGIYYLGKCTDIYIFL